MAWRTVAGQTLPRFQLQRGVTNFVSTGIGYPSFAEPGPGFTIGGWFKISTDAQAFHSLGWSYWTDAGGPDMSPQCRDFVDGSVWIDVRNDGSNYIRLTQGSNYDDDRWHRWVVRWPDHDACELLVDRTVGTRSEVGTFVPATQNNIDRGDVRCGVPDSGDAMIARLFMFPRVLSRGECERALCHPTVDLVGSSLWWYELSQQWGFMNLAAVFGVRRGTGRTEHLTRFVAGTNDFIVAQMPPCSPLVSSTARRVYLSIGAVGADLVKIINETENTSEARQAVRVLVRVLAETEQSSDAELAVRTLVRLLSDTSQILEGSLHTLGVVKIIAETVNLSDASLHTKAISKVLDETLQIGETTLRVRDVVRVVQETQQLVETLIPVRVLVRAIAETIQSSESTIAARVLARVLNETLQITETTVTALGAVKVIDETLSISGTRFNVLGIVKQIDEIVQIAETLLRVRTLARVHDETTQLVEARQRVRALVRARTETQQTSEAPIGVRVLVRLLSETIQVGETALTSATVITGLIELADVAMRTATLGTGAMRQATLASVSMVRALLDNIGFQRQGD